MRNPFPYEEESERDFHRAIWQSLTGDYFYSRQIDDMIKEARMTELLHNVDFLTEEDRTRCLLDYRLYVATNLGGAVLGQEDDE